MFLRRHHHDVHMVYKRESIRSCYKSAQVQLIKGGHIIHTSAQVSPKTRDGREQML